MSDTSFLLLLSLILFLIIIAILLCLLMIIDGGIECLSSVFDSINIFKIKLF